MMETDPVSEKSKAMDNARDKATFTSHSNAFIPWMGDLRLSAVSMKTAVSWDAAQCSLLKYRKWLSPEDEGSRFLRKVDNVIFFHQHLQTIFE
jgi:hypothetical protein